MRILRIPEIDPAAPGSEVAPTAPPISSPYVIPVSPGPSVESERLESLENVTKALLARLEEIEERISVLAKTPKATPVALPVAPPAVDPAPVETPAPEVVSHTEGPTLPLLEIAPVTASEPMAVVSPDPQTEPAPQPPPVLASEPEPEPIPEPELKAIAKDFPLVNVAEAAVAAFAAASAVSPKVQPTPAPIPASTPEPTPIQTVEEPAIAPLVIDTEAVKKGLLTRMWKYMKDDSAASA